MTVAELKNILFSLPNEANVDVLIECDKQYQFPLNEVAFSTKQNLVILMHEAWGPENVDERKNQDRGKL